MTGNIDWLKATPLWGRSVAESPTTSKDILRQLALHASNDVREAVAENANAPLDIVLTLALDESADVRYSIAENHNSHVQVLNLLAVDANPFVATRARKTLDRLQGFSLLQLPFSRSESVNLIVML